MIDLKGSPNATGDEYAEVAHPEEFATTELSGPFGTRENPVNVTSFLGYRVVGCQGRSLRSLYFCFIWTFIS